MFESEIDPAAALLTCAQDQVCTVVAALNTSRRCVGELAALDTALESRPPAVRRAWAADELDLARFLVVDERTRDVERLVLGRARATPAGRLGPVVNRIVTRVEPESVLRRRETAVADRGVVVSPGPDGTAEVRGRLPRAACSTSGSTPWPARCVPRTPAPTPPVVPTPRPAWPRASS